MLGTMEVMPVAGKGDAGMQQRLHQKDENRIKAAAKGIDLRVTDFLVRAFLQRAEDMERHVSVSELAAVAFVAFRKAVKPSMSSCLDWSDSPKRRMASRKMVEENGAIGHSKIGKVHHSSTKPAWRKSSTT